MSSTALDDHPFERVAPSWEAGRPVPQRTSPPRPSGGGPRPAVVVGAVLGIATAVLAVGAVVAGFALGLPMGGGLGDRALHPQSAADLAGGFELTAGDMELDLRDVAFPAGTTRTTVDVGFGQARVIVPRGVEVVVDGRVVGGQMRAFGRAQDGLGVDSTVSSAGGGPRAARLVLDARVGFGQLRVVRG